MARRVANDPRASFSRFIIRLATIATSLSVAVMIIAVAVVFGFKETIKEKMFVFWGQVQIAPFNPNPTSIITPDPFTYNPPLVENIRSVPGVVDIQPFAVKAAILSSATTMQGIKLKGIDSHYSFSSNNAISFKGDSLHFPAKDYAHQVILSSTILDKLALKIGDSLVVYFVDAEQEFPRIRKLQIAGVFHTGMEEVDNSFALCDIRLLRRISNWDDQAINGYQVHVRSYGEANSIADKIYQKYLEPPLSHTTIEELYPNIFNWLSLMNTNAYIILIIMTIVATINLTTALLIFIMERTTMIGILTALGMSPGKLQMVFVYHAGLVASRGILWGTLLGTGICLLQQYTHFIKMDESAYYMQYAPIKIVPWHILVIDLGTLFVCFCIMLLPSLVVRATSTVKALRFK